MKILSNDYLSNVPEIKRPAQGGTANFARLFSSWIKEQSEPSVWYGLIIETSIDATSPKITRLKSDKGSYYKLVVPRSKISLVGKSEEIISSEDILKEEIFLLSKLLKKLSPDIVLVNGIYTITWILLMAAKKAGIPIITQHAGIFKKELSLFKENYSVSGLNRLENMEIDSSKYSAAEVFLNQWSLDNYENEVCSVNHARVKIIPIPFDQPEINKSSENGNIAGSKMKIGVIARWDRIKNHQAILSLAEEIKKQGLNWEINAITKVPQTGKNIEFKRRYSQNITVVSQMDKLGVYDFIRSMDLMILPSLFETASFVVLESLSCNKPILISDTVGFSQTFMDLGAGDYVIKFDDSKKVIKRIRDISDKTFPTTIINSIRNDHLPEKIFQKYISLFKEII